MVESVTKTTCDYVKTHFNIEVNTLMDAINSSIDFWKQEDISFFQSLLKVDEVANNRKLYRRIDTKIYDLQLTR